jgi:hypothetical protein
MHCQAPVTERRGIVGTFPACNREMTEKNRKKHIMNITLFDRWFCRDPAWERLCKHCCAIYKMYQKAKQTDGMIMWSTYYTSNFIISYTLKHSSYVPPNTAYIMGNTVYTSAKIDNILVT